MARAIWTGSVSFGLVNVPVGLYSATEDHTVHFSQFEKDTPDRIRTIGITDFVEQEDIDPIFYRNTYYLAPQGDGAERPYGLLLQAMREADRVAIACFVMRGKQYLAALRPDGDVLALETMYFADEIRDPAKELDGLPNGQKFQKRELDMARSLIDSMTVAWDPEQYKDTYRDRVMELIEAKRRGEKVVTEGETGESAAVLDLMQALERSLGRSGETGEGKGRTKRQRREDDLADMSKDDLYGKAQELGVSGRSKMNREQLEDAVRKAS